MDRIIRIKKVELSARLLAKARSTKSPQHLRDLCRENNIELTPVQANGLFAHLKATAPGNPSRLRNEKT